MIETAKGRKYCVPVCAHRDVWLTKCKFYPNLWEEKLRDGSYSEKVQAAIPAIHFQPLQQLKVYEARISLINVSIPLPIPDAIEPFTNEHLCISISLLKSFGKLTPQLYVLKQRTIILTPRDCSEAIFKFTSQILDVFYVTLRSFSLIPQWY